MRALGGVVGVLLILAVLWDAFEVVILPRRVVGRLRLARWFYRLTWAAWAAAGRRMRAGGRREAYLSVYGPLSLLVLIMLWAVTMVIGFGFVQWTVHGDPGARGPATLGDAFYLSGTTFFTLGLGDVVPTRRIAKVLTVAEGGTGFLFLAVIVGYLPVMYQAFSRREVSISMLDARAGSPPSAAELLRRHRDDFGELASLLRDWERWSAGGPPIAAWRSCARSTSRSSTAWPPIWWSRCRRSERSLPQPTTGRPPPGTRARPRPLEVRCSSPRSGRKNVAEDVTDAYHRDAARRAKLAMRRAYRGGASMARYL